jgi:hypothetical protein
VASVLPASLDNLQSLLDRPIAFHRCFVTLTGSVAAALMLSQAVYWSRRTRKDGWFYKTQKEWEAETGLTRREQDTARRSLRATGFWEENLRGVPAKLHFKVSVEKLLSSLAESAKLDDTNPSHLVGASGQALLLTETTTDTTSKNLRPLTRPSSISCGKSESAKPATPQQRRFAIIARLTDAASAILANKPDCQIGDLTESLKQWAADNHVPYFDAWPGAATPIEQAITNAIERRKTA